MRRYRGIIDGGERGIPNCSNNFCSDSYSMIALCVCLILDCLKVVVFPLAVIAVIYCCFFVVALMFVIVL